MIWYPYEQMKTMRAPYEIVDAEGVYLYTREKKLIDSVSSWWSVIHGYKHPELNRALISQAEKFSHVMLGGLYVFLGFRKRGRGGGAENGASVLYEPRGNGAHDDPGP